MCFLEAIANKRSVVTLYNGAEHKLAPHLLFERHGDLFVSALNLNKNWRTPEERRLGQFKLAGLGQTRLLEEQFVPLPNDQITLPRSDDMLVLAV